MPEGGKEVAPGGLADSGGDDEPSCSCIHGTDIAREAAHNSRDGTALPHPVSFDFLIAVLFVGLSSSCTTILRFIFAFIFKPVSYLVNCSL